MMKALSIKEQERVLTALAKLVALRDKSKHAEIRDVARRSHLLLKNAADLLTTKRTENVQSIPNTISSD